MFWSWPIIEHPSTPGIMKSVCKHIESETDINMMLSMYYGKIKGEKEKKINIQYFLKRQDKAY